MKGNQIRLVDPTGRADEPASDQQKPGLWQQLKAFGVFMWYETFFPNPLARQTPQEFASGVVDKAASVSVDPVKRIYAPGGNGGPSSTESRRSDDGNTEA